MHGIITTDNGTLVDVEIIDKTVQGTVLRALLDAAGERRRSITTTTHGATVAFRVPRDIAEQAGILNTPEPVPPAEPVSEPKKAAAKKAPAKAAPKPADVPEIPAVEIGGGDAE